MERNESVSAIPVIRFNSLQFLTASEIQGAMTLGIAFDSLQAIRSNRP
jgi:hypothetical protein